VGCGKHGTVMGVCGGGGRGRGVGKAGNEYFLPRALALCSASPLSTTAGMDGSEQYVVPVFLPDSRGW
jgi:hypothetical protein